MAVASAHEILQAFGITAGKLELKAVEDGLINDTYKVFQNNDPSYILQKINTGVFANVEGLMHNIVTVLPYLKAADYSGLSLLPSGEGSFWLKRDHYWRVFNFIPESRTFSSTTDPEISREAGRIISRFHQLAGAVPLAEIQTSLQGFHSLSLRRGQLQNALERARKDRLTKALKWMPLAKELMAVCEQIPFDKLPLRLCHNDTKLNNILFSDKTHKALCLIDLDTLMPGYLLYDFGDAARVICNPLPEGHKEVGQIRFNRECYRSFSLGFQESGLPMSEKELESLPWGVVLMPLLHGIRALTDYLLGDAYYKTSYAEQNMDRAASLLMTSKTAYDSLVEMNLIRV